MDKPFFSVVMPAYNASAIIHQSVESVLRQSYDSWEMVVFNDGSTDNTLDILKKYQSEDSRLHIYSQSNAGYAVARANAIAKATGSYIIILDADDMLEDDFMAKALKTIISNQADIIVPDIHYLYPDGSQKKPNSFVELGWTEGMIFNGGEEAFSLTIPWKLHGHQIIKSDFAKRIYTVDAISFNRFNSDEYITRVMYYEADKVTLSSAQYYYYIGLDSITRRPL